MCTHDLCHRELLGFTGNVFSCSACFIRVCRVRAENETVCTHAQTRIFSGDSREIRRAVRERPRASRHVRWGLHSVLALYGFSPLRYDFIR